MEQQRLVLWRSRMNLIRQARDLMEKKLFSDAAIVYEKYLKVLQIVYRVDADGITPDLFKGRPSEITVISSVYWDLLRVYDTNPRFRDRQWAAAEKLLAFAKFSPLFPNILRNAEIAYRSAKNPQPYRHFLKKSNAAGGRCFVANAAFGGPHYPEVLVLCQFRDKILERSAPGRKFIALYYTHGPALAEKLNQRPTLKAPVRAALRCAARGLSKFFNLNT